MILNPTRLLVSIFFYAFSSMAVPYNVDLEFPLFSLRNLTLLGDSYLRNGFLGLTQELEVPTSSSGSVIYDYPIPFFDPESNTTASFSTRFSFSVENLNPTSFGDGLAFFLSPDNETLGSPGGCLGLVNSSSQSTKKNRFIAVEFDTKLDVDFDDPDENHVGFDINSLVSIKTVNPILWAIDLKSGNLITAWIDYSNEQKKVEIFLSYSNSKPDQPILCIAVDLSDHLKEYMFLGFSASTEGSTERHYIENWSFHTTGFSPLRPRIHSHNVSENTVPINPPLPMSESGNLIHRRIRLGFGIGFPAFFCAAIIVFGFVTLQKWRAIKTNRTMKAEVMPVPRQFTYKELKFATRGFHQSRILGHGSFGTVYKAYFVESNTTSAVKKSKHTHEGKNEFLSELSIIACLRHKNLVQLQGWCVEKGELLLVYEFMPNGSLDKVLYPENENGGDCLKWLHRYNIAVGLASALTYLHQECEQQVIHRDVKTSNIMLDGGYNARLGDFGLARLMDHDKSPVSTLTAGTMGYLAPEYLQYGKATEKTDVFSYGVVILELACGRRPIEREKESEQMVNLVDCVWKLYSEGKILEAADDRMKGEFDVEGIKKMLLVGLSCVNPDSVKRPSMRRVLQILKDEAEVMSVPKVKPSLVFSCSLPRSIDEIVSDCESPESKLEIRLE